VRNLGHAPCLRHNFRPVLTRRRAHANIFLPQFVESTVDPSVITELRKTPLNAVHRRLGAKMVNFGGWDMPVEYPATGGLVTEHKAVRSGVGVFDVSHMGDIRVGRRAAHHHE